VSTFICPSDVAQAPPDWPGQNNYYASQGLQFMCDLSESLPSTIAPNEHSDGPFYFKSKVKMLDLKDGLSNTALFSEKRRGQGFPDPRTDMYIMPNQTTLDATFTICEGLNTATATPLTSKQGYSWVMGEMCCTTYNHVAPPNTITCAGSPFPGTMANMAMAVPPSSMHTGGVNVLFGDGSVHFIRNNIDLAAWRALGTRASGEVFNWE
jgi:prepilin-type processing-associated H-X9-DG protein